MGRLAVYVTSHGFGHLNRTVAVLNRVPADIPITIRCHENLFDGWRERLARAATLEHYVSDSGAVNPPGDSAATDGPETLRRAKDCFDAAMASVDDQAARLRAESTAAVLCDAPPVPLVAAERARIPGYLLANFTWAEIYRPHARKLGGDWPAFVHDLHHAYQHATAVFRTEPALPAANVAPIIDVGMVVNHGKNRRAELRESLKLDPSAKLVYFYIGRYGQNDLPWDRLEAIDGFQFIAFHPAPVGPLKNLHVVPATSWNGADLAASTDVMVAKAGYGTACEAMAHGTPLIYPPRSGFAEHGALDRALLDWGGGVPASPRDWNTFQLGPLLSRALTLRPGPPPFGDDGAERVARYLTAACRGR
jgi:hypothetical protein